MYPPEESKLHVSLVSEAGDDIGRSAIAMAKTNPVVSDLALCLGIDIAANVLKRMFML